jgi:FkbM family methyltransferase
MKQIILNSWIGLFAIALRDKVRLFASALMNPEAIGMVANDQIATMLVTKICKSGCTFIDVGAHIGSIISEVHNNNKSVKITAIEAIPEKINNLKKRFKFAEFHECAVGESDGEVSFFINVKKSGYSSLIKPTEENVSKEIKVALRKLDSIINPSNIDTIKIDVEGAELGVLLGGERVLLYCRPVIMFESSPIANNDLGYTKEALWQYLNERNFEVLLPNRVAHNGSALTLNGFIDSHVYPRHTTNYFAVPKERRLEIRDRARKILGINAK